MIAIYRGPAGKGSALRAIFEAAVHLEVKACVVVDADLRSITSDWIRYLVDPVVGKDYHFVAPVYSRYKYDGTITNNVVYNLTRALYGKRIRQPIGGDFAFSCDMARHYMQQPVWDSDIARFGIDIWMTTEALTRQVKICQSNLGVKIHDAKDPAVHLAPMFRQVCWTLFHLMGEHEDYWKDIRGSVSIPTFGGQGFPEPDPIAVDQKALVEKFKVGVKQFGNFYKSIFSSECYEGIRAAARRGPAGFFIPIPIWVKTLYEVAATFHHWDMNRYKLVDLVTPLYQGRVASFINESKELDSSGAESLVEEQAEEFEKQKDYLLEQWFAPRRNNDRQRNDGSLQA